ncbi:MAG: hypothetical protein ACD_3C00043G0006 [uncultured bacterium (gcode 4)]|uniref:Uncharacterized protein n=1 Tax=uncultured bacterium (gcode 4) TaxID=1234023 RepID=K2G2S5_9BACT|nr:MAG: hypothetical protein ACD_3C00043G0006 [uncultured bacterium (gcode 4)]
MKTNYNSWFSSIVAILLTAFLVVVSAWVLSIVLQESRNTRLVYNSISTYAWAEWAQEYALLKIKNHEEWFQDSIVEGQDSDSKLLAVNPGSINKIDQYIEYTMSTNSKKYSSTIASWDFEIIPLFFDPGSPMQINSKHPSLTWALVKSASLKLVWNWNFVWNIIWNDASWQTFGMAWTWSNWVSIWGGYSVSSENGQIKKIVADSDMWWDIKKVTFSTMKIKDFIAMYNHNYLILYNPTNSSFPYSIESLEWFSTPKTSIIASSRIWNFKQNVLFEEDKNRYFEALKYSIFNK